MEKSEQLELLLKQALSSTTEPIETLNQKIKSRLKENKTMKPARKMTAAALVAAIILIMSVSAFAAWQLLSPKQVAQNLGDKALAKAFDSENAIQIKKSVTSGDYTFTLLGITSGKNLSDFKSSVEDIHPDRTYTVVSIARKDGNPMPAISDQSYGKSNFIVSPLIKGQKPWQVNIFTMNGGSSECVIDGILYRMLECDSIEMFADRGVYLYAGIGSFINNQTVSYNEITGEITTNVNNKEANALFNLPLDMKKADHEKSQKYLKELLNPAPETTTGKETPKDWDKEFANGTVVPGSIKQVTYDKDGLACYQHSSGNLKTKLDYLFKNGEIGVWKTVGISGDDKEQTAIQFSRDKNGLVTGREVKKAK